MKREWKKERKKNRRIDGRTEQNINSISISEKVYKKKKGEKLKKIQGNKVDGKNMTTTGGDHFLPFFLLLSTTYCYYFFFLYLRFEQCWIRVFHVMFRYTKTQKHKKQIKILFRNYS